MYTYTYINDLQIHVVYNYIHTRNTILSTDVSRIPYTIVFCFSYTRL